MRRLSIVLLAVLSLMIAPAALPVARAGDKENKKKGDKKQGETAKSANARIEKALDSRKVDINFSDTPVLDALAFLQDVSELTLLAPKPAEFDEVRVSLRLKGISLRNALKLILASSEKLKMRVACGVILVGHKATIAAAPETRPAVDESWSEADRKTWSALAARTVTLNFNDTPVADVQGFLGTILGLPGDTLPIEGKVADDATWSIRAKKLGALEALTLLAEQLGRVPTMKKGKLTLAKPGAAPAAKPKGDRGPPNAPLGGGKSGD